MPPWSTTARGTRSTSTAADGRARRPAVVRRTSRPIGTCRIRNVPERHPGGAARLAHSATGHSTGSAPHPGSSGFEGGRRSPEQRGRRRSNQPLERPRCSGDAGTPRAAQKAGLEGQSHPGPASTRHTSSESTGVPLPSGWRIGTHRCRPRRRRDLPQRLDRVVRPDTNGGGNLVVLAMSWRSHRPAGRRDPPASAFDSLGALPVECPL